MRTTPVRDLVARSRRFRRRAHRRVIELLHPRGYRDLPMGVNLIGPPGENSIAVMTRDYAAALRAAGIPVTIHLVNDPTAGAPGRRLLETGRIPRHAFTLIVIPPLYLAFEGLPPAITAGRFVIANWLWEQTELPDRYVYEAARIDEFWASSEFVRAIYAGSLPNPVTLIPHPIRRVGTTGAPRDRSRFGLPEDRFLFLTIAASSSSFMRKNPLGSLRAFRAAFPHGQTEAVLAIKLLTGEFNPSPEEQRRHFAEDPAFDDDVILIIDSFDDAEMTDLVDCCDAFVSLHRAEGFGLGAAEAMGLGKPVIVTNWSGPTDFLTDDNSLPVPYEMVTIDEPGIQVYRPGLQWAEPDLRAAAQHMRALVDDPTLGPRLGRRAREDIERRYSIDAVGRVMAARLHELHDH